MKLLHLTQIIVSLIVSLLALYQKRRLIQKLWRAFMSNISLNAINRVMQSVNIGQCILMLFVVGLSLAIYWNQVFSLQMSIASFFMHLHKVLAPAIASVACIAMYGYCNWRLFRN
jgi:hypothetical protein